MRRWSQLNSIGKLLWICCVLNVYISAVLAMDGETGAIYSILIAAFCGLSTYRTKYDRQ